MNISDTLQCVCSVTCVGSPASTVSRLLPPVADLLSSCLLSPLSSLLPPLCCRLFVVSRLLMFPVSARVSPVPRFVLSSPHSFLVPFPSRAVLSCPILWCSLRMPAVMKYFVKIFSSVSILGQEVPVPRQACLGMWGTCQLTRAMMTDALQSRVRHSTSAAGAAQSSSRRALRSAASYSETL